jgi:hypothetical protein
MNRTTIVWIFTAVYLLAAAAAAAAGIVFGSLELFACSQLPAVAAMTTHETRWAAAYIAGGDL